MPYVQPKAADNDQPSIATSAAVDVQPSISAAVDAATSAAANAATSAAVDVQPSDSAATNAATSELPVGTVVILDFGKKKLPKNTYTEFYNIFQVEQPSLEIDGALDFGNSQKKWTNYINRKKSTGKHSRFEIDDAKKHDYVLAPDGVTQFTIKAYHGVKRGERGGVYQVAVEFSDKTIRCVDKKEIKKHSSASLQLYFNKLKQPNPEINLDGLQLF